MSRETVCEVTELRLVIRTFGEIRHEPASQRPAEDGRPPRGGGLPQVHQLAAAQGHQAARDFPSDDAATKLVSLALRNISAD